MCGLSRLSPRSLVATLCFMGAGFATVYVMRHALALVMGGAILVSVFAFVLAKERRALRLEAQGAG